MAFPTHGIVRNGVVVPDAPLPEGVQVEIRPSSEPAEMPPDLEEELRAWRQASAKALNLVDRMMAAEGEP